MAISKSERKAIRAADGAARKKKRDEAKGEILGARVKMAVGFGGAYLVTQMLPALVPGSAASQGTVDIALAGIGGYFAVTNDGELGDYALGAALVGALQTLDNVGARVSTWLEQRRTAA